jgi:hypothetical protein
MGTYCTHRPWLISPELPREVEAVPVVFALRPRLGQIERKLISVPELDEWRDKSEGRDTSKGPRAQPEWYKFVWPLHREYRVSAAALNVRTSRRLAAQAHGAAAYVQLRFLTEAGADLGGLHWEINQHGTAIPDSFVVSDPYVQSRDAHKLSLPAPDQFRLVDLEEMLADPFGEIAYGTAADSLASQPPPTASQDP